MTVEGYSNCQNHIYELNHILDRADCNAKFDFWSGLNDEYTTTSSTNTLPPLTNAITFTADWTNKSDTNITLQQGFVTDMLNALEFAGNLSADINVVQVEIGSTSSAAGQVEEYEHGDDTSDADAYWSGSGSGSSSVVDLTDAPTAAPTDAPTAIYTSSCSAPNGTNATLPTLMVTVIFEEHVSAAAVQDLVQQVKANCTHHDGTAVWDAVATEKMPATPTAAPTDGGYYGGRPPNAQQISCSKVPYSDDTWMLHVEEPASHTDRVFAPEQCQTTADALEMLILEISQFRGLEGIFRYDPAQSESMRGEVYRLGCFRDSIFVRTESPTECANAAANLNTIIDNHYHGTFRMCEATSPTTTQTSTQSNTGSSTESSTGSSTVSMTASTTESMTATLSVSSTQTTSASTTASRTLAEGLVEETVEVEVVKNSYASDTPVSEMGTATLDGFCSASAALLEASTGISFVGAECEAADGNVATSNRHAREAHQARRQAERDASPALVHESRERAERAYPVPSRRQSYTVDTQMHMPEGVSGDAVTASFNEALESGTLPSIDELEVDIPGVSVTSLPAVSATVTVTRVVAATTTRTTATSSTTTVTTNPLPPPPVLSDAEVAVLVFALLNIVAVACWAYISAKRAQKKAAEAAKVVPSRDRKAPEKATTDASVKAKFGDTEQKMRAESVTDPFAKLHFTQFADPRTADLGASASRAAAFAKEAERPKFGEQEQETREASQTNPFSQDEAGASSDGSGQSANSSELEKEGVEPGRDTDQMAFPSSPNETESPEPGFMPGMFARKSRRAANTVPSVQTPKRPSDPLAEAKIGTAQESSTAPAPITESESEVEAAVDARESLVSPNAPSGSPAKSPAKMAPAPPTGRSVPPQLFKKDSPVGSGSSPRKLNPPLLSKSPTMQRPSVPPPPGFGVALPKMLSAPGRGPVGRPSLQANKPSTGQGRQVEQTPAVPAGTVAARSPPPQRPAGVATAPPVPSSLPSLARGKAKLTSAEGKTPPGASPGTSPRRQSGGMTGKGRKSTRPAMFLPGQYAAARRPVESTPANPPGTDEASKP